MSESQDKATDAAGQRSGRWPRLKSFFASKMSWSEAKNCARADLEEAKEFDRRGLRLGRLLFALALLCLAFTVREDLSTTGLAFSLLLAVSSFWWLEWYVLGIRLLYHKIGDKIASALMLAIFVAIAFLDDPLGIFYDTVFAVVFTTLLVITLLRFIFTFRFNFQFSFVVILASLIASIDIAAIAVAGAYPVTIVLASFIAGYIAVFVAVFVARLVLSRAYGSHERAKRNEERVSSPFPSSSPEPSGRRKSLRERCETLLDDSRRHMTLGLAGRRGLGKTNLLSLLLKKYMPAGKEEQKAPRIKRREDLENSDLVAQDRVRAVGLFIRAPTDFREMNFLAALLEQLAQEVSRRLAALLPDVRSHDVERELQEKRRMLRRLHWLYAGLAALVIIATGWAYWQSDTPDPLLASFRPQSVSVIGAAGDPAPSELYRAMTDSLAGTLEPRLRRIEDSLKAIGTLLNPRITVESWNSKGDTLEVLFDNEFLIGPTWDSLQQVAEGPTFAGLDSVRNLAAVYEQRLDSIAAVEARYAAARDSLQAIRSTFGMSSGASWWPGILFYAIVVGSLIAFAWAWQTTKEGVKAFQRRAYDVVRDEVVLYERTEALLDRLKYHMTFGESRETQAGVKPGWMGLSFGLSRRLRRQVTRAMRPYTVLSLMDEYRRYAQDVIFYLNGALGREGKEEGVRIVIAIDELDKVLDTKRLHEMLKSLKAVFEIEDVYYLLSISEDALGTYRLRHMQTKNEVDSAFTHIFSVPPMDAKASLWFYEKECEKQPWPAELIPAAIVLGGGVPRDMHRLSQMLHVRLSEQAERENQNAETTSLSIQPDHLLDNLYEEDQNAAADLMREDACLGAVWRQSLIETVMRPWPGSTEEVEARLIALRQRSVEAFEKENACSGDAAKQAFHRTQLLLYGMIVKGYVYHRLSEFPSAEEVEEIRDLVPELEPLRAAIFDLANDPLGVWETLKRDIGAAVQQEQIGHATTLAGQGGTDGSGSE